MMKLTVLFALLLYGLVTSAQNRNSQWVFGDSAGINFKNISNPQPTNSSMNGRGSCAAVSDTSGDLLFYSWNLASYDDSATFITNFLHDTIENGSRLTGGDEYSQIVITSFPNSYKYFIFHLGILTTYGLYYSIVDMNQNGGLGRVMQKNVKINNLRPGDCLTAVKHGNGRDWWVISKLSDGSLSSNLNRFYVFMVTTDSINSPIIQDFNDAKDVDFQKVIWHPVADKFMLINVRGYMSEFDFDRCSGLISLNRNIYPEQSSGFNRLFWEGAYSPSGNIFYTCLTRYPGITNTGYLLQYDLLAADIPASADTLDSFQPPIGEGAVRLAPDSKIYFSHAYQSLTAQNYPYPDSMRNYINENLSVINSPDSLGAACNYTLFSFHLGGKRTYWGLPNNPNYDLGPLVGSLCDTLTIGIASHSPNRKISAYPNPFIDKIKFEYVAHDKYKIVVTDITGKKVYDAVRLEKPELELSFLKQGLYFVTISDTKNVYQTKIIKQ